MQLLGASHWSTGFPCARAPWCAPAAAATSSVRSWQSAAAAAAGLPHHIVLLKGLSLGLRAPLRSCHLARIHAVSRGRSRYHACNIAHFSERATAATGGTRRRRGFASTSAASMPAWKEHDHGDFSVLQFQIFDDNYSYLLVDNVKAEDGVLRECAAVDPVRQCA
eukprot:SAG11_NODE_10988_length_791_cov_1.005780_1_plen_165_part_00